MPALAGALAVMSALSGGKFVIDTGGKLASLGLQTMVVAESGVGKDIMYSVISEVEQHGPEAFNTAHPVSPSGLHQALSENKTLLWPVDEFGRYLDAATKEVGHDYAVLTKMMELHTSFWICWNERTYSDAKAKKEAIAHPMLAGAYATTPGRFLKEMDKGTVVDGLLGRMLVFNMAEPVTARPLSEMENRIILSPDAVAAVAALSALWPAMRTGIRGIGEHWFSRYGLRQTPRRICRLFLTMWTHAATTRLSGRYGGERLNRSFACAVWPL